MSQDQESEGQRPKGQRIAQRLRETWQRCDELLTALLPVKRRAQKWRFLSRSQYQTTYGPSESRNRWLHTKDRALKCLPRLMWTGGVLQSISGSFTVWLPCSTIVLLGLSTGEHKLRSWKKRIIKNMSGRLEYPGAPSSRPLDSRTYLLIAYAAWPFMPLKYVVFVAFVNVFHSSCSFK